MNFRTEIEPVHFPFKIDLQDRIFTLGSCFAEVIGQYLTDHKFHCTTNPYGVIFNPVSLFHLLLQSITDQKVDKSKCIQVQNKWVHFDFHSIHFAESSTSLISHLNQLQQIVKAHLTHCQYIFLTLGTSFVYKLKESDHTVANCHKVPANNFEKILLTTEQMIEAFRQFHDQLLSINPAVKIILTISPVRHTKDTLQGNSLSKSLLRVFTNEACQKFRQVHYYPSYEIVMDDLRDYRYFEDDLIHINSFGQKYIIEHLRQHLINEETNQFINDWSKIKAQLAHKSFDPDSEEQRNRLLKLRDKILTYQSLVDIQPEINLVNSLLY